MDDASDNASFVGEKRNSDGNPDTKRRPTPIGIVDDVMSAGDAADGALDDGSGEYFLLKVGKPHLQDEASPDARDTREEESEGEEEAKEARIPSIGNLWYNRIRPRRSHCIT